MNDDAQRKARAEVKRAQSKFERTGANTKKLARLGAKASKRARDAGLTLREIGEAANLHWSRVGDVLGKK